MKTYPTVTQFPLKKLRAKPFLMQEKIANQFAQGRIQQLPKWYDAMRLHPMAPPAQNTCIPEQVGHFQKPGTRSLLHQQQLENSKTSLYRYGKFNPASVYGRKPPVIEYDEDQIRSVFYRDHPYELDRPRLVQDQPQTLGKLVWSDIYAGEAQVPLSGESVVQRTLHLMQHKHTRHEAYRTALSEFYAAREAEEKRERVARELAREQGAKTMEEPDQNELYWLDKPTAKRWFTIEEKEAQAHMQKLREQQALNAEKK